MASISLMSTRQTAMRALEVAVLGLLVVLVVGQLAGQPILLSYVQTGSMEPVLDPGDGFIAVPAAVAGPVEVGDVVVFDANQLNDGGLVTHRVVGTTSDGRYVTKGDANPFTDQDGGEPPVHEAQVVAVALQLGGNVVVIPFLGVGVLAAGSAVEEVQRTLAITLRTRALLGTQGLAYLLFGLGLLAYVVSFFAESRNSTRRVRSTVRNPEVLEAQTIVVSLTVLLMLVISASMVFAGGTQTFEIVSSEGNAPGPRVIHQGTSETLEYAVPSNGIVPVVVFLEPRGDGTEVEPSELYVKSNSEAVATVTLTAPPATGAYVRGFTEHRYLAVLPQDTLRTLYTIHPWLPIVVIDLLFGVGFAGLGWAVLGTGRVRMRPTRGRSLWDRITGWFS